MRMGGSHLDMETKPTWESLTTDAVDHLPLETALSLVASERRRVVLQTLSEHPRLSLPDLAEEVAVREFDQPFDEIDEHTVLEIYTALWHRDIPKLADADVITYDQERDLVLLATADPHTEGGILRTAD